MKKEDEKPIETFIEGTIHYESPYDPQSEVHYIENTSEPLIQTKAGTKMFLSEILDDFNGEFVKIHIERESKLTEVSFKAFVKDAEHPVISPERLYITLTLFKWKDFSKLLPHLGKVANITIRVKK